MISIDVPQLKVVPIKSTAFPNVIYLNKQGY